VSASAPDKDHLGGLRPDVWALIPGVPVMALTAGGLPLVVAAYRRVGNEVVGVVRAGRDEGLTGPVRSGKYG
jgi:hypothetical protein